MLAYYRQARNLELGRKVAQIRIRAERRVGQLLKEIARKGERAISRPEKVSEATALSGLA